MPLFNPLDFVQESIPREIVFNQDEIPKEMDIFYRQISAFLPEGKSLADLTHDELLKVRSQYRFDCLRPGIYQGITGFGGMS